MQISSWFVVACALVSASLVSGNAEAEGVARPATGPSPQLPSCATAKAAESFKFLPNTPRAAGLSTTTYGEPGCDAFVVDVYVNPETAQVSDPKLRSSVGFIQTSLADAKTEAACQKTHQWIEYFVKKQGATTFTSLGAHRPTFVWKNNMCAAMFGPTSGGDTMYAPPTNGTDVYRMASHYVVDGAKVPVHAGLYHIPNL